MKLDFNETLVIMVHNGLFWQYGQYTSVQIKQHMVSIQSPGGDET